jgi:hypothetical protein
VNISYLLQGTKDGHALENMACKWLRK